MTIYTEEQLNAMKCDELRELNKELNIPGAWKNPKRLLVENILTEYKNRGLLEEVSEPEKIVTIKEVEPDKFSVAEVSSDGHGIMNTSRLYSKDVAIEQGKLLAEKKGIPFSSKAEKTDDQPKKPEFVLLNEKDEEVYTSTVKLNVVKYAIENNICNAGWINRSIKTGEKIYIDNNGKNTRPKNSKYNGVGYSVVVR